MRRTRRKGNPIIGAWKSKMMRKLQNVRGNTGFQALENADDMQQIYKEEESVLDGVVLPSGSHSNCNEYEEKFTPTFEDQDQQQLDHSSAFNGLKRDIEPTSQRPSKRLRVTNVYSESPSPEEEDEGMRNGEVEVMPKKDQDIEWARIELERKKLDLEERRVAIEERRVTMEECRQNVQCTHWVKMEKLMEEVIKSVKDSTSKVNENIVQLIAQMKAERQPKNAHSTRAAQYEL